MAARLVPQNKTCPLKNISVKKKTNEESRKMSREKRNVIKFTVVIGCFVHGNTKSGQLSCWLPVIVLNEFWWCFVCLFTPEMMFILLASCVPTKNITNPGYSFTWLVKGQTGPFPGGRQCFLLYSGKNVFLHSHVKHAIQSLFHWFNFNRGKNCNK